MSHLTYMIPDWLADTLATTPAFAAVYLGVGIPWALALLPRADWRKPIHVLAAAFAFGPALLTAWMFILATIGAQSETYRLRLDVIAGGMIAIALVGVVVAWRRALTLNPSPSGRGTLNPFRQGVLSFFTPKVDGAGNDARLRIDEKLLIALIVIAVVVRWFVSAYSPFVAYDTFWVYGYQGRLYSLLGYIPNSIGYYPQFLSLQYAFGQIVYGAVNDHAARAVIPFINLGSIFAVYVLGDKLFGRRVAVYAAAIWALYPHVAEWWRMGDLEIALTTSFTLATAYFLSAWAFVQSGNQWRRYALLAGLTLGIGLWTKPTMGAFVWGMLLYFAIWLIRTRFWKFYLNPKVWLDWKVGLADRKIVVVTLLAALPLGGVWYVRNLLLGHDPIKLPPAFWLTQAMRSGAEFGWPLLGLLLILSYAFFAPKMKRPRTVHSLLALGLILLALVPSIVEPRRMSIFEFGLLALGAALLVMELRRLARSIHVYTSLYHLHHPVPDVLPVFMGDINTLQSLAIIALPYFVTWFYSYSYHYRLSFAIVPILLMPVAVFITLWTHGKSDLPQLSIEKERYGDENLYVRMFASESKRSKLQTTILCIAIVALAIPGIVMPLYDGATGWDALWSGELADDMAKYRSGNQALIRVVDGLQIYLDEQHDEPLRVVAPGVETLPFFFPLEDIDIESTPTRLDDLDGVTYFIDSHPQGTGAYEGIPIIDNQVLGALRREDIMRRAWGMDDGIFRYDIYELHLDQRWQMPQPGDPADGETVFGGFARLLGHDLGALDFWVGRPVYLTLYWQPVAPTESDYMIYVHLRNSDGEVVAQWDAPVAINDATTPPRYYSTRVWEPGEVIADIRILRLTEDLPHGAGYSVVVGMYDLASGVRVPLTIDGAPAGDGYVADDRFTVMESPE